MHSQPGIPIESPLTVNFPENTPAEQVVKTILIALQSYHQRELDRLNQILAGVSTLYLHKLVATWEHMQAIGLSHTDALQRLTQIIAAELDGGDMPL
jgi:hypothetical protein